MFAGYYEYTPPPHLSRVALTTRTPATPSDRQPVSQSVSHWILLRASRTTSQHPGVMPSSTCLFTRWIFVYFAHF